MAKEQTVEQLLREAHKVLIADMLKKVKAGDPEVVTPAFLNVLRQLLKDNGIDASPKGEPKLLELKEQLPEFGDGPFPINEAAA